MQTTNSPTARHPRIVSTLFTRTEHTSHLPRVHLPTPCTLSPCAYPYRQARIGTPLLAETSNRCDCLWKNKEGVLGQTVARLGDVIDTRTGATSSEFLPVSFVAFFLVDTKRLVLSQPHVYQNLKSVRLLLVDPGVNPSRWLLVPYSLGLFYWKPWSCATEFLR